MNVDILRKNEKELPKVGDVPGEEYQEFHLAVLPRQGLTARIGTEVIFIETGRVRALHWSSQSRVYTPYACSQTEK